MKATVCVLTLALALSVGLAGLVVAGGGPERPRQVLGSGASEAAGGGVSLRGTLGQPVVGAVSDSGGDVKLGQGFWGLGAMFRTYLPVVFREES